jgi:Ca2+-binding EF-hand superfamily protein
MTYQQVVKALENIALSQHNVRYANYGDLYRDLNSDPSIKYDVFYITPNQYTLEGDFNRFSFNLFYISRLENVDGDNMLQVQSIGKEILDNVVKRFCEQYDADTVGSIYYQPFTQRFADECCGLFMTVTLEVAIDSVCVDY